MSTSTAGDGTTWTGVARTLRLLLVVLFVGIALPGALVTPVSQMLLLAPLVGAFAALVAALVNPAFPAQPGARRAVIGAFATAALIVPFLSGIGLFGPSGAWVVLGMILLTSTVAGMWIADCDTAPLPPSDPRRMAALQEFVCVLPTEALLREWRATGARLEATTDPQERAALAKARGIVLDELISRDPAGLARWLEDGGPADPGPHLRQERGPAG